MSNISIQENKINDFEDEIIATVAGNEVKNRINSKLKQYSKTLNIRGFRKGKVPPSVIERKFRKEIYLEIEEELFKEIYEEILKKLDEYDFISNIDKSIIDKNKDYTVKARIIRIPTAEDLNFDQLKHEPIKVEVTEEEIQKEIERLQKTNADWEEVADDYQAQLGDVVTISGTIKKDGENFFNPLNNETITLGDDLIVKGFDQNLVGAKKGEKKNFKVKLPDRDGELECEISVEVIKKKKFPDVKTELPQKLNYESYDDMIEAIKQTIMENKKKKEEDKIFDELMNQLKDMIKLDLPETVVKSLTQERILRKEEELSKAKTLSEKEIAQIIADSTDELQKEAINDYKDKYLITNLKRKFNIEVSDSDIDEEIAEIASVYGLNPAKARSFLKGQEAYLHANIVVRKIKDKLLEVAFENYKKETEGKEKKKEEETTETKEEDKSKDVEKQENENSPEAQISEVQSAAESSEEAEKSDESDENVKEKEENDN